MTATAGNCYAANYMRADLPVMGNISTTGGRAPEVSNDMLVNQAAGSVKNSAEDNNNSVSSGKTSPGINIYIIAIIAGAFLSLIIYSLTLGTYYSIRICSTCEYKGKMEPITLSTVPVLNWIIKLSVKVFPEILYFYQEKGKFECPKCYHTKTNFSIKKSKSRSHFIRQTQAFEITSIGD